MNKATRIHTKEHNRNLVLRNIFSHESISRAEIARITRLTPTTVSDIVADLLKEQLVGEIGIGSSVGGKSPILLSLIEDSRWLIGLDLANHQFRGAVVNLRGKIREMVTVPLNDRRGDEALALVYTILDRLIEHAHQPLLGIGVGTPGLVQTGEGIVLNAVNLGWVNLPLTSLLQERYHLPVTVLNDSQAAAVGEFTYGKGLHLDEHLVVINVHHGIGAGIIINGALFQGDGGSAGEIGHSQVVAQGGLPCQCGKTGCLETVASAQALLRRAREETARLEDLQLPRPPQEITLEALECAFNSGDARVTDWVLETATYMGVAIAGLVNTLNIRKIILVGDMTRFGGRWLTTIREVVQQMAIPGSAQEVTIEIGSLGGNAILLGASAVLANNCSLLFHR